MADLETTRQIGRRKWRGTPRFDVLLPVFLIIGWSLIFATATLGLQNSPGPWLEVGLVSKVSADYSVKASDSTRVAPIRPQVVEAVKQDQALRVTPTPRAAIPTFTQEPTLTPTMGSDTLQVNAGGPYTGDEGSPIAVTAELAGSVLNFVPGVVNYAWDLDNDGQYDDFNGPAASATFYDEGDYVVAVQATDLMGRVGVAVATILVSNVPPLVELGQDMLAEEGQEVAFMGIANDPGHDVLLYEWDFGDGQPKVSDTLTPHHTYQNNGDYAVRLTVRDNDGGITEETLLVNVINLPPLVDAGSDQRVNEGERVIFNGTATDPGSLDTLTYAWDFSYDGRNFTSDASGPSASKIYANGPLKTMAALRVRDEDGGETIDTIDVTVGNVPPVITGVSNNGPVGEGSPLALTVTAEDVGNDPLTFAVDWDNDGSFDEAGPDNTISNIWYNQGDYTVRIRVDDGDGGEVFATTQVSTLNEPPIAVASATSGVLEGSAVSFNAGDSSDPGSNDALTYSWSFGDGQSGSGENTTHTYEDNGVYSATLTVTDDSGASSSTGVAVAILNANPTADAGPDHTIDENTAVTYNGSATDPGVRDILTYTWTFGDNTTATGASGTHLYPDGPRQYSVGLQVVDDDGGTTNDSFLLTVRNLSPWAVTGGSYTCDENETIELTATADDVPDDVSSLEFWWDLDSNPNFEAPGRRVSYNCNQAGNQTVRLRVRDKDYNSNEDDGHDGESFGTAQIEISNLPPVAVATANPLTTTINVPIIFDASGSYDPSPGPDTLTYRWNFGDGITMTTTSITVTHTYTDDGLYTVSLRVFDSSGDNTVTTLQVRIANLPPTAVAVAAPTTVAKGSSVTFDGSGSSDPDDTNLTYQWNFGNGSPVANGVSVNYTYPNGGTYTAILTVTDDNNDSATASVVITVNNAPPVAEAGPDQTINEGDAATFDGSSSTDPDDTNLTYQWDFGDGSPTANGVSVNHTYQNGPANRTVTLTVTDGDGVIGTDTLQVTVNNVAPTAEAGSDQTVNEGDPVTFNGSGSDPGGDGLTFEWDFDYDGSNFTVDATDQNPSTTFPDVPATRTIALRVTDSDGAVSAVDTAQVTINNVPPTARANASATAITLGETITFDASASSDPGADTLTYQWDFGDTITGSGVNPTYTYSSAGQYDVTLTVTDEDGASDTDTIRITVN